MTAPDTDEVEGLDPEREAVCPVCHLVHWLALGHCPTCEAEGTQPILYTRRNGQMGHTTRRQRAAAVTSILRA